MVVAQTAWGFLSGRNRSFWYDLEALFVQLRREGLKGSAPNSVEIAYSWEDGAMSKTRYSAVFTGSACASGSAGTEGFRRVRLAVGGFQFDQCEIWLYGQGAAARVTGAERERGQRSG